MARCPVRKIAETVGKAGFPFLVIDGEELNRWYPAVPDSQNAALVLRHALALLKTFMPFIVER